MFHIQLTINELKVCFGLGSVFQGFMGHCFHIAFIAQEKSSEERYTKRGEKQQQGCNTEPLDTIYGLQEIFVHNDVLFKDCDASVIG